jgi:hypothetical protein
LVTAYSTTKDECYPNTISDALSLLSTFAKQGQDTTPIDAVVSYHESTSDVIQDDESTLHEEVNSESNNKIVKTIDDDKECNTNHVSFNEHVMAAIISEASSEADRDQFFGASFSQLQDVDDVYHDDEPDIVCCAHIIDTDDDNSPPTTMDRDPDRDFELIMYLTSQRVNNKGDVCVVHYERGHPDLISHEYESPCAESIIDYADAIRLKLKLAGIHDSDDLMAIFENRSILEASAILKTQLNDVEQTELKTSTVHLLKEETIRHIAHAVHYSIRYDQMIDKIGIDDEPATFPQANML